MYDIIIIGSGAGGATMAYQLADSGKKILIVERGDYVPVEKENWDSIEVFEKNKYTTTDLWLDKDGRQFRPGMHYNVGGNTKFYGAALFRLRKEDFKEIKHYGGISPAWPIQYEDLKDYYLEAEKLFHVHGKRGSDPTEPFDSEPYPYPPLPHEPRIQEIVDELRDYGLHPFELPIGVNFKPHETANAPYILNRFDGFPDAAERKGDAHLCALAKALEYPNVELMTNTKVIKINTNDSGTRISEIVVEQQNGNTQTLSSELLILSAGAINSAALLLESKSEKFPNGLANTSDQVGRNYMFHQNTALVALYTQPNPTKFGKTFGINDFYHARRDYEFPLGHIQMLGKSDEYQIRADSPVPAPGFTFELMAEHAVDFWLTSEDLPDPENRVTVENGQIKISYSSNNEEGHQHLKSELIKALKASGKFESFLFKGIYFSKGMDIASPAHQNGTTKMGLDPKTSVVDINCKAHDLENLYIVDGGFFVSSGAVNPALTIIAMALRVGEHLKKNILTS